ncbi:hypothetical protein [Desulfopila aestuarii]|uniref:Uncharacterized protein n=1 Tax=Desulfopila aestuarii DSM 18488 TaxID=1121416 RepID=A0A1M7XZ80_9BACT|nr:hypothetical protein [Desulfopila aestuarii]SHO44206.1 hypothetical protein SAMN02745220_00701 [Desulfopila aestuarii DSM 18488]
MKVIVVVLAGIMGGIVNSIGIWGFGALGINEALGFNMTPTLSIPWLMPRLISSGLWGLLFLLPFWRDSLIKKGILLSCGPLLFMLFVMFPKMGAGMMGLNLGNTAPAFAVFFTLLWGVSAAIFLKVFQK